MPRKQNMLSNILNDLLNRHYTLLTKLKTSATEATLRWKYKIGLTVIKKVYSCGSKMICHEFLNQDGPPRHSGMVYVQHKIIIAIGWQQPREQKHVECQFAPLSPTVTGEQYCQSNDDTKLKAQTL